MNITELKNIIKQEIIKIREQQAAASCQLPPSPQGPYPGNFNANVWVSKWENLFTTRLNNQGQQSACDLYFTKKDNWVNTLNGLQNQNPPKCNPKWQNMLNYKIEEANNIANICNIPSTGGPTPTGI